MVYVVSGRTPLQASIDQNVLNFGAKIVKGTPWDETVSILPILKI